MARRGGAGAGLEAGRPAWQDPAHHTTASQSDLQRWLSFKARTMEVGPRRGQGIILASLWAVAFVVGLQGFEWKPVLAPTHTNQSRSLVHISHSQNSPNATISTSQIRRER